MIVKSFPFSGKAYLDEHGQRKSLSEATHLVVRSDGRVGVLRETPEIWFQPMGFLSSHRGQPWFLYPASELGIPSFLRHDLVRATVDILEWCGIVLRANGIDSRTAVISKALQMGENDQLKLRVEKGWGPSVCAGCQILFNKNDFGSISAFMPDQSRCNTMVNRYIASPFYVRPNNEQLYLWAQRVIETFALGGVHISSLGIEQEYFILFNFLPSHHESSLAASPTSP